MNYRLVRISSFVLAAVFAYGLAASAETRLFVPHFTIGPEGDLQFLAINANERDSRLDLWAFTSAGNLVGQVQLALKAHSTRTFTMKEAFSLPGAELKGWMGAVSTDENIQVSYRRIGGSLDESGSSAIDAVEWVSRETTLDFRNPPREVLRLSNPNSFAAHVTVNGRGESGVSIGTHALTIAPFAQTEINVRRVFGDSVKDASVSSTAEIVSSTRAEYDVIESIRDVPSAVVPEALALMINSDRGVGAYQVTVQFDPKSVQFNAEDIGGGSAEGFDTKPLVVNIDNANGKLTMASFQVGHKQAGQLLVARVRVRRRPGADVRFGIHVEEVTDIMGNSILG